MSDNLDLWNRVEKTNPEYTKKANVKGNHITSIAPQYQIKQGTDEFGRYGVKWGLRDTSFDYTLKDIGMIVFHATFYFPDGSFPIVNSVQLFKDNAQQKLDDDFAKKVETDTLTKAMSKIGFNADIFLGKFDDNKYVQQMKEEFKTPSYTDEQKDGFAFRFTSGSPLEFYCFIKMIGEEAYTELYNLPEKDKVKYKNKCKDLESKGNVIVGEIVESVTEMVNREDPAYAEDLEGLEDHVKKVVASRMSPETLEKIKQMKGAK